MIEKEKGEEKGGEKKEKEVLPTSQVQQVGVSRGEKKKGVKKYWT